MDHIPWFAWIAIIGVLAGVAFQTGTGSMTG